MGIEDAPARHLQVGTAVAPPSHACVTSPLSCSHLGMKRLAAAMNFNSASRPLGGIGNREHSVTGTKHAGHAVSCGLPVRRPAEADIRIRSEVEAPFRAVRLVLFGFFVISASVGALIATTQVIAALQDAPGVSRVSACSCCRVCTHACTNS